MRVLVTGHQGYLGTVMVPTTEAWALTPFDDPSWLGLMISGNFNLGDSRSRPVSIT